MDEEIKSNTFEDASKQLSAKIKDEYRIMNWMEEIDTEQFFIKNFQDHCKDATLIVVSHRMPLVNLVDRIIVMNDGKIVDDGPRDEIIKKLQGQA